MPSFVACVLLAVYCLSLLYVFITIARRVSTLQSTSPVFPHLQDLFWPCASSFVFVIMHKACQLFCYPLAGQVIQQKTKHSQEVYESKLTRFGSAVFKLIFFVSLSAYCWIYVLADAQWTPPELFGSGSTKNCWGYGNAATDMRPMDLHFKIFYNIALAYHFSEMVFQLMFELEKPDFVEMFAHHATTCFLVAASYFANFVRIGSLVLMVHYVSDVPVYAAKVFVDTRWAVGTFTCLVGMLVSWGYLRLWCLPSVIIRSVWHDSGAEIAIGGDSGMIGWSGFVVALIALFCLHCYWYWCFLQMGYRHVVLGETKDRQANLSAMDMKEASKKAKSS